MAGEPFICSCLSYLQQQVCTMSVLCTYTADFFEPQLDNQSVVETLGRFLRRGMVALLIYAKK